MHNIKGKIAACTQHFDSRMHFFHNFNECFMVRIMFIRKMMLITSKNPIRTSCWSIPFWLMWNKVISSWKITYCSMKQRFF